MKAHEWRNPGALRNHLDRFKECRSGATVIEYALVAGFISISILVVLASISENVRVNFFELVAGMF